MLVIARSRREFLRTRGVQVAYQHATRDVYSFVPDLPMNQVWTDEILYQRYGITADEVAYIESQVKEMPAIAPKKSEEE